MNEIDCTIPLYNVISITNLLCTLTKGINVKELIIFSQLTIGNAYFAIAIRNVSLKI